MHEHRGVRHFACCRLLLLSQLGRAFLTSDRVLFWPETVCILPSQSCGNAQRWVTRTTCSSSGKREANSSSWRGYGRCYLLACMRASMDMHVHACIFVQLQSEKRRAFVLI